jgi:hypothetical protein
LRHEVNSVAQVGYQVFHAILADFMKVIVRYVLRIEGLICRVVEAVPIRKDLDEIPRPRK